MILKATGLELNELYEAASEVEKIKPWEWMSEYQLFIVEDPETHLMGFCCVMGKQAHEKGLKVYLGIDGLDQYLKMLDSRQLVIDDERFSEFLCKETCLSVSFQSKTQLNIEDEQMMKELKSHDYEGELFPKFKDCLSGFLPVNLNGGWQCRFLKEALKQVKELSLLVKNTPSFMLEADQVLLRVQTPDKTWKTLKISLSVFLQQLDETGAYYGNELAAYRISKLPATDMVFEIAQFLMPSPVEEKDQSRPYYPMITAVVEQESKQLVFAEMSNPSLESQEEIVVQFANTLLKELEFKPRCLITDCEPVMKHFKDFSLKTKIPLKKVSRLEAANEFVTDLLNIERELDECFEFDEEKSIDTLLETTQEICQNILSCDSLSRHLSRPVKQQFANIVELFHVVMLGHFQEFPDHWSIENVEYACKEILPSLLTKEELKLVPDILSHYLGVVGEAQLIPHYIHLQNCVSQIYI